MIFLTFFLGLIVNFIGYIPPGNINLTLVQIAINRGMKQAVQFIIAFSAVEFFFTFFIIHVDKWLSNHVNLSSAIDWVMILMFSTLAIITWLSRNKPPKTEYSQHASIRYGILLGFLNPMQVPFWAVAGTYLLTHEWITMDNISLVVLSLGSSVGAFLCLFLYGKFGRYIQSKFELSTKVINTSIAILFFALALYHVGKIIYVNFFK